MELFVNAVFALSNSRFWLMPLLLICAVIIFFETIRKDIRE